MTALVTGASGFLGGTLASTLIARGEKVRILARTTSKLDHLKELQLEIAYGSLEDQSSLIEALKGIDIVYHCAALSFDWGRWEEFFQTNVTGVKNLLEAAINTSSLKRFLHISTSDVYGYPAKACDESYPITDIGLPYNRSKGMGEKAVRDYHRDTGLPVTIIRPVTIYGPRSKDIVGEIVKLLFKKQMVLINHGKSRAGLLYVDNAVEGITQAATSPNTIGQAYNLRDETDETWKQYVEALADGLEVPYPRLNLSSGLALAVARLLEKLYSTFRIPSRPLLTRHAVYLCFRDQGYSIEKAQHDFGYKSKVSFDEGISRTLSWLRSEEGKNFMSRI